MLGEIDDEILEFVQENSSLKSELERSLGKLLPKPPQKKQVDELSDDYDMVKHAGKKFGADVLKKWQN